MRSINENAIMFVSGVRQGRVDRRSILFVTLARRNTILNLDVTFTRRKKKRRKNNTENITTLSSTRRVEIVLHTGELLVYDSLRFRLRVANERHKQCK